MDRGPENDLWPRRGQVRPVESDVAAENRFAPSPQQLGKRRTFPTATTGPTTTEEDQFFEERTLTNLRGTSRPGGVLLEIDGVYSVCIRRPE
jgi:hypothetical protein